VIRNAGDVAPKGDFVFRPATVDVQVLPPVDTSDWTAGTVEEHVREVRNMFARALGQPEQSAPGKKATARRKAPAGKKAAAERKTAAGGKRSASAKRSKSKAAPKKTAKTKSGGGRAPRAKSKSSTRSKRS
jgi:putative phosphoserine phosphatase/1-acylglycerol-3-phosphate O-acyltransferase